MKSPADPSRNQGKAFGERVATRETPTCRSLASTLARPIPRPLPCVAGRPIIIPSAEGVTLGGKAFPSYVALTAELVLAGAPIDPGTAESRITQALAAVTPAAVESLVAMIGGRTSGALSLALWLQSVEDEYSAEAALQCAGESALNQRFNASNARTVDLPGVDFLQVAERLFRENRLARGCFPALGRPARLSD